MFNINSTEPFISLLAYNSDNFVYIKIFLRFFSTSFSLTHSLFLSLVLLLWSSLSFGKNYMKKYINKIWKCNSSVFFLCFFIISDVYSVLDLKKYLLCCAKVLYILLFTSWLEKMFFPSLTHGWEIHTYILYFKGYDVVSKICINKTFII